MPRAPVDSIVPAVAFIWLLAVPAAPVAGPDTPAITPQPRAQTSIQPDALATINASLAELTLQVTRLRAQVDAQAAELDRLRRRLDRVVTPDSNIGVLRWLHEGTGAKSGRLPAPPRQPGSLQPAQP